MRRLGARDVPFWKRSLSHEEWVDLKLSVGTHKKNRRLSPVEVASLIKRVRDSGATLNEISKEILLGTSTISRFLRLNHVPVEFRDLIDWGYNKNKISFMKASLSISYSLNRAEQILLLDAILQNELKKNEIQKIIELKSRSKLDIKKVINEVLNDRTIEIKRNIMIGFIDDDVKPIINKLDVDKRDLEFIKLLKNIFPLVDIYAAKIDEERYSLTTDEFGQSQIELKSSKNKMNYNTLIMTNIKKTWGDVK